MRERRFALLRHDVKPGEVHWDLCVEGAPEGKLFTWRLAAPLPDVPGERVAAERTFDHRAVYLDYEGEISGDRGCVARVAGGVLEDLQGSPGDERYEFRCEQGSFALERGAVEKLSRP